MNNVFTPKAMRQLVILASAMLLASLVISGINAYVTLAAPPKSPYVSDKVGFEGQLSDSSGNPVTDGNYNVTFSLYSQASGGSPLWDETQTVSVTDGLYSVQLGTVDLLPSNAFDGARWLGVKVGNDSEMTPRISISAVPFALNARQAMGLQGFDISADEPQSNNGLLWDSTISAWTPRAATFPDLGAVGNNANPQDFLANYRSGAILTWADADTVSVSAGQVMIDGYMRSNSESENAGFTSGGLNLGLDTGTAQSNTRYYVYAVADDTSAGTFQLIVSANSSSPTGKTHYRKLGWFWTSAGSNNIQAGSVANVIENDTHFIPGARVYNTVDVAIPNANQDNRVTFNSERFDNDSIHDLTTNKSRLTAHTPGRYLIFGNVYVYTSSSTDKVGLKLKVNDGPMIARNDGYNGNGGYIYVQVMTVYYLEANDFVELFVVPPVGTDVSTAGQASPEFGMVQIGD